MNQYSAFWRINPILFQRLFVATVIHEVAHLIEKNWLSTSDDELCTEHHEFLAAAFRCSDECSNKYYDSLWADKPPWHHGHGRRFVRCACHLIHRAIVHGIESFSFGDVVARQHYGIDSTLFRNALAHECRKREREPIIQILDDEEPPAYSRVWEHLERQHAGRR